VDAERSARSTAVDRVCGHSFLPALFQPVPVVLDLGANHGDFTAVMSERYGAKVTAVEPNPALADGLSARGADAVMSAALAPRGGTVNLTIDANDQSSTIMPGGSTATTGTVEVPALTMGEVLAGVGDGRVDLVKLDIEGAELEVLAAMTDAELGRIDQFTIEFHDSQDLTPPAAIRRTCRDLKRAGFEPIRMSVRHWGDVLFVRRTRLSSLERSELRWVERPRQIAGRVRRARS
jgi:FkbM family methyltransferase